MGLITYENLEDGQKVTANIFNERFAQIVAQLNGHITDVNIEDDGISKEKLKAEVYESLYPVGSMYVNFTDNTNPATLLGFGVWSAVAGRVIVGYDGTQTEFNAAEKTGGHKSLAAHTHTLPEGRAGALANPGAFINSGWANSGGSATAPSVTTGSTGAGDAGNLQPYIVGYVWKRTS
jgi:hypothetical protein